jgi:ATP-dependent Lon protease
MWVESIFSLLKNLKNQGEEEDWEIIDGEFYYKGQVMTDDERIKFFEERSREKTEKGKAWKNQKDELLTIEGDLNTTESDIQSDGSLEKSMAETIEEPISYYRTSGKRGRPAQYQEKIGLSLKTAGQVVFEK